MPKAHVRQGGEAMKISGIGIPEPLSQLRHDSQHLQKEEIAESMM